jgi:hypothetical protein
MMKSRPKKEEGWRPVPIKPSRSPLPQGFPEDSRAWDVGDSLAVVAYRPELGWTLYLANERRCPSMREVMTARARLVPQDLQMAVLVPPYSGHIDEGVRFVNVVEIELPKVVTLGTGK